MLQSLEDVIANKYKLHFWKSTSQEAYLSDHMKAGSAGHALYQEAKANDHGVMTFDELEAEAAYDAVWAHASLLHCPRRAFPRTLQKICRSLKQGGWHCANFKLGKREGRDKFDRLYNIYTRDELCNAYQSGLDWSIEHALDYESSGFDQVDRNWLAITVRKA